MTDRPRLPLDDPNAPIDEIQDLEDFLEESRSLDYESLFVGTEKFTLRHDQTLALNELRYVISEGIARRPLCQAPTGYGKTYLGAEIIRRNWELGKRSCFVVPYLILVNQTLVRLCENTIPPSQIGVNQADHQMYNPKAPVQIATPQTLKARGGWLEGMDLVLVDEAHTQHQIISDWMRAEPQTFFVGLSATPWSRGLGKLYDYLIKPTDIRKLIDEKQLCDYVLWCPYQPELKDFKTSRDTGDFVANDIAEVMSGKAVLAGMVDAWMEKARGLPTIVFCCNVAHAEKVRDAYRAAGVRVDECYAKTPSKQRDQMRKRLESGEIEVIVNVNTLTTGVDWDVRCIQLARPTKSEILYVQQVGRGLRTAKGKDRLVILDHSNSSYQLGTVKTIDHDEMDKGERKKKAERKPKEEADFIRVCPQCTAFIEPADRSCSECGWEKPTIREVEGQLIEVREWDPLDDPDTSYVDFRAWMRLHYPREMAWHKMMRRAANPPKGKEPFKVGWKFKAFKELFGVAPSHSWPGVHNHPTNKGYDYDKAGLNLDGTRGTCPYLTRWFELSNINANRQDSYRERSAKKKRDQE